MQNAARILAISGSLRNASRNTAVLRAAAAAAARDGIAVTLADSVRRLPPFDPDLEAAPPGIARRFREACDRAAGVLLAVPEYAFGIPGALKNALDWTVGSGSLYRKPVAVIDVSPEGRGAHVGRALDLVLSALDADVVRHAVPIGAGDLDAAGAVRDPDVVEALGGIVLALAARAAATPPTAHTPSITSKRRASA